MLQEIYNIVTQFQELILSILPQLCVYLSSRIFHESIEINIYA